MDEHRLFASSRDRGPCFFQVLMTELHEAASLGDLVGVEDALKKGLNPNEPDPDWGNRTPLHIAASNG